MLGEGIRSTNSSTPAKGTERKREEKLNYESLKGGHSNSCLRLIEMCIV